MFSLVGIVDENGGAFDYAVQINKKLRINISYEKKENSWIRFVQTEIVTVLTTTLKVNFFRREIQLKSISWNNHYYFALFLFFILSLGASLDKTFTLYKKVYSPIWWYCVLFCVILNISHANCNSNRQFLNSDEQFDGKDKRNTFKKKLHVFDIHLGKSRTLWNDCWILK